MSESEFYCESDGEPPCMGLEDLKRRHRCATQAIRAHGNTELTKAWYRNWLGRDVPTTVQYSLSCFLMDEARKLVESKPGEHLHADE